MYSIFYVILISVFEFSVVYIERIILLLFFFDFVYDIKAEYIDIKEDELILKKKIRKDNYDRLMR